MGEKLLHASVRVGSYVRGCECTGAGGFHAFILAYSTCNAFAPYFHLGFSGFTVIFGIINGMVFGKKKLQTVTREF